MLDAKEAKEIIKWWKDTDTQGMDFTNHLCKPLMEAFGDDVNEILEFLDEIDVYDLWLISGIFEDIYSRFTTDEVWDALERLENKFKK